jgi:hypothetical protein
MCKKRVNVKKRNEYKNRKVTEKRLATYWHQKKIPISFPKEYVFGHNYQRRQLHHDAAKFL